MHQLTASSSSVGEVVLACAEPGAWRFSLAVEPGDAEIVRIALDAPAEAFPPKFEVSFSVPQGDVCQVWNPHAASGYVPVTWDGRSRMRSSIASNMPVKALVAPNDENRLAVVCSEASRVLDMRSALSEHTDEIGWTLGFFNAPEAPLSHYEAEIRLDARPRPFAEAVREASAWLSARPGCAPCVPPPAAFEPLYSTWYAFHQDVHADAIEAECAEAAKDGMKAVILDDGWQTDDNSGGYAYCGDWDVSCAKFPDGMAAHVARVHALGMKYLVWFSVPFVGYRSRNYERFNGKFLSHDDRLSCATLDPRFREVRDFLADTFGRAVREWNLDGLKLDFIDRFRFDGEDPAIAENFAGRDIRSLPDAVDALLSDISRRLRAVKPDILVEFRQSYIGPAIRRYGNLFRAADCAGDTIANRVRTTNLRLTSGASAVHSDMLLWHPAATPEAAALQILSVLFSVIQYSVRLRDIPPAHHAMVRHWLAFTREHRDALLHGEFRPHGAGMGYPVLEGATEGEAVYAVYAGCAVCRVEKPRPTVIVVNATGRDGLYVELPAAPKKAEVFDTFGNNQPVSGLAQNDLAGACAAPETARFIPVPCSGYLRLSF